MRRIKAIAIAAVLSLGLAACGGGSNDPAAPSAGDGGGKEGGTIYLVSKGFQHRFWQAVKEGAEKAGQEFGYKVEFVGPANEQAITEQLDQLKTALNTKPAAIGFAALDSGAAAPLLEQAKSQNIPVIAFDSGVDSDIPLTTVQTDNKAAAAEAAKQLAGLLNNKGKVALVCHDQTSQTGKDRCFGFKEWMEQNAPDIEVVPEQFAGEVGKAADVTKALLSSNPDVTGVYGTNEAAATGVVQGVKESGNAGKVTVVGFDSGKPQLDAIKDGSMAGAVTQSPVKIGYETVKAAISAIKGEKLEKVIDSGFAWYNKDNMDSDEIKPNLYE